MSPREIELLKLQQETQAKYIAALNELQMLKIQREIAETNQAIVKAKLETVTDQKNIINLLSPAAPLVTSKTYAAGLSGQQPPGQIPAPPVSNTLTYDVLLVSYLQY